MDIFSDTASSTAAPRSASACSQDMKTTKSQMHFWLPACATRGNIGRKSSTPKPAGSSSARRIFCPASRSTNTAMCLSLNHSRSAQNRSIPTSSSRKTESAIMSTWKTARRPASSSIRRRTAGPSADSAPAQMSLTASRTPAPSVSTPHRRGQSTCSRSTPPILPSIRRAKTRNSTVWKDASNTSVQTSLNFSRSSNHRERSTTSSFSTRPLLPSPGLPSRRQSAVTARSISAV